MVDVPGGRPTGPLPDPRGACSLGDLVACLERTRVWAGSPSHRKLAKLVTELRRQREAAAGSAKVPVVPHQTISYLFKTGRKGLDFDLLFDVLTALEVPREGLNWWGEAWTTANNPQAPAAAPLDTRLPSDDDDFVGRVAELDHLDSLSDDAGSRGVVAVSIGGLAGVGKTRLAVRAAHRLVRSRGVGDDPLYVNLQGFDPHGRPPADPAAAMAALVEVIKPGTRIPEDQESLGRIYRNLLRDRRDVLVLDNALDGEQVQPLLSGIPNTVVIVTSRATLAGLPGVVSLPLDVLSEDDAIELLTRTVGRAPDEVDRGLLARVARLSGRLPLALTVAAAQLRADPNLAIADYADHRDELGLHDEVESSLALSYGRLTVQQRLLFRLLGLHPGPDLDVHACAALAGLDLDTAAKGLAILADRRLLDRAHAAGYYKFHDLVRTYAAARTKQEDLPRERRDAQQRLLTHYQYTTAVAMDRIAPYEAHLRPSVDVPATAAPALDSADAALAWLEDQRRNLVAIVDFATASGFHRHATDLAQILFRYFVIAGHHADAHAVHSAAVRSARELDDHRAEGTALRNLGVSCWQLGQNDNAVHYLHEALAVFTRLGDRQNAGRTHNNLGLVYQWHGQHAEARDHHQLAFDEFQATNDDLGMSAALGNLAIVDWNWGHYDDALRHFRQDLAIARRLGDRDGVAITIGNMGNVHLRLGHPARALHRHERAMKIYRETRNRAGIASAHANIAAVHEALGEHPRALERYRQALADYTDLGD
ncbi:tetratricopeptide repeat protein, partial [Actinophytocola sp.]|uniref:tetratricopeptide repeat protein n=1 Tax=Actinophytocola sp. TaxID=1872138 RepID=UPI003899D73B